MADEDIFGPNLGSLKGNTVSRSGTTSAFRKQIIPPENIERYRQVTIIMEIMFVKNHPS